MLGNRRFPLSEHASVHFDAARAVAALAVMIGHVRGLCFVTYADLPTHSLFVSALYAVTSLGHQSVIVFFVLSGFFIVSSITKSLQDGRWSWTSYLVNRVTRLSIVLAPALVLGWVADQIGMASRSGAFLYQQPLRYFFSETVASRETVRVFLGNLFYLQNIVVPVFGSNGPLWSLNYEFWYYILFPLGLCAIVRRSSPRACAAYLLLGTLTLCFVGRTIASYFLIWLLGGVVALMPACGRRSLLGVRGASTAAIVAFGAMLAGGRFLGLHSGFLADFAVALLFAIWMRATLESPGKPPSARVAKTARSFAGFSYTLYLTHFPILFAFRSWFVGNSVWRPDAVHLLFALGIIAVLTGIAYLMAQVTEAKTSSLRRTVMALVTAKPRPEQDLARQI